MCCQFFTKSVHSKSNQQIFLCNTFYNPSFFINWLSNWKWVTCNKFPSFLARIKGTDFSYFPDIIILSAVVYRDEFLIPKDEEMKAHFPEGKMTAHFLEEKRRWNTHVFHRLILKATTRFELVIRVLQTHALPLGYVAIYYLLSDSYFIIAIVYLYVKS